MAAIAVCAVSVSAKAVVLTGWDFDPLPGGAGNYGPSPYAATASAANLTAGGLTRGSGIGTTNNSGAANAWGGNDFTGTSFATALSLGEFASFTVQAATGYTLSFDSIDAYNIRRSGTGPSTGQWQYSLDGSSFIDIGSSITWGATTSASGNAQGAISLSGISALQGVSSSTVVTFRVVTWGATSTGGTWYLNDPSGSSGTDFSVSGSVTAVPEPTAAVTLLGGLGAMFWTLRRRRVVD